MRVMATQNLKYHAAYGWGERNVSFNELPSLVKESAYSQSILENEHRCNDSFKHASNIIAYDIDNDADDEQLTIIEAKDKLEALKIKAILIPSKSHKIEKFTDSGVSKGVKDRFRVIIPVEGDIERINTVLKFKAYTDLIATDLNFKDSADSRPLTNASGLYYPSPRDAQEIIIEGDFFNINGYVQEAEHIASLNEAKLLELKQKKDEREKRRASGETHKPSKREKSNNNRELLGTKEIDFIEESEFPIERKYPKGSQYLQLVDYQQFDELYASDFVHGDILERYEDMMLVRSNGTYYYFSEGDKLVYDTKQDKGLNALHVIMENNEMDSPMEVAKLMGDRYYYTNTPYLKDVMTEVLKTAKNDKDFEMKMKEELGLGFFKLGKDTVEFLNEKESLDNLISKKEIVNCFKENRAKSSEMGRR